MKVGRIVIEQKAIVVEQFISKYPYKQRIINNEIIFRGSINNLNSEANNIVSNIEIKENIKFIIIYFA